MKKLILFTFFLIIFLHPAQAFAKDSFVRLQPLPYSSHVLGESLVIYGETDFDMVTVILCYPDDENYLGIKKYTKSISAKSLREGHVINTLTEPAFQWPTGTWRVIVGTLDISDTLLIPMVREPVYDRTVRIAYYKDKILQSVSTYPCRGMNFFSNVISVGLEDGRTVKIYSWDNLRPVSNGSTRLYIATYQDEIMTDIKTYTGTLSLDSGYQMLNIAPDEYLKIFYWDSNISPVNK